ncbi:hypothetical protein GIB67_025553 [Kingdonia uniflora]|uniref:Uncharacterized protein n=1 Tax=Kingdonia uniflora TaxID=39325 RepID=A0A7J7M0K0_9MAGN|nr:hypothetical protein GIB67_025553 [Kingdonia uniflora]
MQVPFMSRTCKVGKQQQSLFFSLKALDKYKFEQSLEHTSEFIERLEKELEEYHKHVARYRRGKEAAMEDSLGDNV